MFVLGAGVALPPVELTDATLEAIGVVREALGSPDVLARSGVRVRRVSLPLEYIRATGNRDILEGRKNAVVSPTALGVEAARQALEKAGLSIEQVGLIIADTATPYQTCPSEAQRIAGAFGLKIPSFDVVGGAGALALYLHMVGSWKPERIPDYVLLISTNTPSQQTVYAGNSPEAWLFGDSAAALVVSPTKPGRLTLRQSSVRRDGAINPGVVVEHTTKLCPTGILSAARIAELVTAELDTILSQFPDVATNGVCVVPQLFAQQCVALAEARGISTNRVISGVRDVGYAFGSSGGYALATQWEQLEPGQRVAMIHAGDGIRGSVVLERVKERG